MGRRRLRLLLDLLDLPETINIFSADVVNRFLTTYVGQVHSMLGLALMPDADLTVPEGGVAALTHEFACLYSRSACSCQTLA
jgi:hypothetical protein